jgi:hypothetical protein
MRPIEEVLSRLPGTKRSGSSWTTRCPAHEDRKPSLTLREGDAGQVLLHCHAGCTVDAVVAAIGLTMADLFPEARTWSPPLHAKPEQPEFSAADAQRTWDLAFARARDDEAAERDHVVYEYLRGRGLAETWEDGNFGILSEGMKLPASIAWWPSSSYRVVGPLYDQAGSLANVQARAIQSRDPRVLAPKGSRLQGTLFASVRGLDLLRGAWRGQPCVLFGEGMTDFIALATVSPIPVLCVPGTSTAVGGIGPWVAGCTLFLALDCDEAGEGAVDATAKQAYERGARSVQRLTWPSRCKDACSVVERVGLEGLWHFLTKTLAENPNARSAA